MATKPTSTEKAKASLEAAQRLNNEEVAQKEKKIRSLADRYMNEKKVTVIGAPMYRAYFGNMMPISLNGIPIYVPLDGNRYEIPESYACEFNARIRSVNEEIEMQKARSNITANYETYPGELDLVRQV
jgi:hypothetical protein